MIPIAKNVEPISTIYQPYLNTPVIITANPATIVSNIILCLMFISGTLDKSILFPLSSFSN